MTKINILKDCAELHINPRIYNIKAIQSLCYIMLDEAYVLFDGDPEKEIILTLKPKKNTNLDLYAREFLNSLIKQCFYYFKHKETAGIRHLYLKRILMISGEDNG